MAEAILAGLLEAKLVAPTDVSVGEPIEGRRAYLAERYGVATSADNAAAVASASMTVLAVKPQDLHDACADLNGALGDGQTVLSIIAGARMARIARELGHRAVVRVMPNTPAQVGAGMSVWTAAPEVTDEAREFTGRMLDALGEQLYVSEEKYLDMATALSASGPAFVWLFLEALIDGGVHVGLPRDMAASLATQTVFGSMRMSLETGRHPADAAQHGHLPRRHHGRGAARAGGRRTPGHSDRGYSGRVRKVADAGGGSVILLEFINALIMAAWIALFVRVILSWFPVSRENPIVSVVFQITDPMLAPIRRIMPRTGMLDLSPLVLFFLLYFLRILVNAALTG